jgi:hypothetical protein
MRLTRRGRIVVSLAYLLALVGLFAGLDYLKHHTKEVGCHWVAEGWECGTAWKP